MRRGTGTSRRWLGMRSRKRRKPSRSARGTVSGEAGKAMADSDQARSRAASSRRRDALSRLGDSPVSPWSSSRPKRRGRGAGLPQRRARHLAGGEPDAEIDQPDEFLAVGPPGQGQADGRDELIAALGLGGGCSSAGGTDAVRTRPSSDVGADPERQVRTTREAGSPWGEKRAPSPWGKGAAFPPGAQLRRLDSRGRRE